MYRFLKQVAVVLLVADAILLGAVAYREIQEQNAQDAQRIHETALIITPSSSLGTP